jgi:pyrroline-5-carboxylate reductase
MLRGLDLPLPETSSMTTLLLVGCGKMGGAMLRGWRERHAADRFVVVEPAGGEDVFRDAESLPQDLSPDVIVLAVKPQMMDAALPSYRRFARPGALLLSIAAGKTLAYFARHLGPEAAVVRAMPNTPAAVGRGITVACANAHASAAQRTLCDRLLAAVGEVAWVEEEGLIDPVTAVSGGGPAYVFLLIEVLAKAGIASGLPEDLAMRLARSTVVGAGELARVSPEPASRLRENVTSPKGTTFEALKILMGPKGIEPLFIEAIAAATRRSRELAE